MFLAPEDSFKHPWRIFSQSPLPVRTTGQQVPTTIKTLEWQIGPFCYSESSPYLLHPDKAVLFPAGIGQSKAQAGDPTEAALAPLGIWQDSDVSLPVCSPVTYLPTTAA